MTTKTKSDTVTNFGNVRLVQVIKDHLVRADRFAAANPSLASALAKDKANLEQMIRDLEAK